MYRKAPLPFTGQKRNFLKLFKQVLNQHIPDDGEDWTILDAFGGSGLFPRISIGNLEIKTMPRHGSKQDKAAVGGSGAGVEFHGFLLFGL